MLEAIRKIAFKNGYYDCDRKALCDYNRGVYFLLKGGIEYVPQEQGVLDEVWNKLFMGVCTQGTFLSERQLIRVLI